MKGDKVEAVVEAEMRETVPMYTLRRTPAGIIELELTGGQEAMAGLEAWPSGAKEFNYTFEVGGTFTIVP